MPSWKARAEMFRNMPKRSVITFLAGVAFLFAAFGAMLDSLNLISSGQTRLTVSILISAVPAALFALFGTQRRIKALILVAVAQLIVSLATNRYWPPALHVFGLEEMRTALRIRDVLTLIFIVVGYILMVTFFRMEGRRYFEAVTEVRLASEIQKELVPPIASEICGFEFYGASSPSGAVGGDLMDVVDSGGSFCAYVADVAAHGVPAGVLMSMVKSAFRMRVASKGPCDEELLPAMNDVLFPLTSSNAFATFAYIAGSRGTPLRFSLAGHPPMFHFRKTDGTVVRHSVENLPLGMFPGTPYCTVAVNCEPGDVLAMITDGLTEVFNRNGDELGYEYLENFLRHAGSESLSFIASEVMRVSAQFGKITDDRTLLLVRCLPQN